MLTNDWTAEAVDTLNMTKSSRALYITGLFVEMLNAAVKCIATCVSIFIQ